MVRVKNVESIAVCEVSVKTDGNLIKGTLQAMKLTSNVYKWLVVDKELTVYQLMTP